MTPAPLLVVVGMRAEAALLPAGVRPVVSGGGDPARLAAGLAAGLAAAGGTARAVLSFGIAGGLDAALAPGDLVAATRVCGPSGIWPADPVWAETLAAATGARLGTVASAEAVAGTPRAKRALHEATPGALVVDLESEAAAAYAASRGLPFAALRAVADTATERVPAAALVGLTPDGRTDPLAVLGVLARRPADLPDLLRIAARSRTALRMLARAVALLGRDLGCPGGLLALLGERLLHMA